MQAQPSADLVGDFIFRTLCQHLSQKTKTLTLPSPEPAPGQDHNPAQMKLDWLKQISKICCDQLIAECQQGTPKQCAPQTPLHNDQDATGKIAAADTNVFARMQSQQEAYRQEVEKSQALFEDMEAAAHRLRTIRAEVQAAYDDLVAISVKTVEHENATDEIVAGVVRALYGGVRELTEGSLEI